MYACDVCGGKIDLVEKYIDGITAGALVCDECGAVYPSYMIDSDVRVRMVYARGNPDEMEKLKKSMDRKMRKNRRMFKSFGGRVMRWRHLLSGLGEAYWPEPQRFRPRGLT